MFEDNNHSSSNEALSHGLRTAQSIQPKPTNRWVWLAIALVAAVGLVIMLLVVRSYRQERQQANQKSSSQTDGDKSRSLNAQQNQEMLAKLGNIVALPDGEDPTIGTVNDLEKLKGKPFFASAELGDKVIVYSKAKKAILYRPSQNKIIDFMTFSNNGSGSTYLSQ